MRVPDAIMDHVDLITAVASLLGSLACVYSAKTIVREPEPGVFLQQVALVVLAVALFANGVFVFPEWALINGHRPTGILVEVATGVYAIVVAGRGYVRNYGRIRRDSARGVTHAPPR